MACRHRRIGRAEPDAEEKQSLPCPDGTSGERENARWSDEVVSRSTVTGAICRWRNGSGVLPIEKIPGRRVWAKRYRGGSTPRASLDSAPLAYYV